MLLKIEDCTYLFVYVDYLICTASVTTICIKILYYYYHAWKVHAYIFYLYRSYLTIVNVNT